MACFFPARLTPTRLEPISTDDVNAFHLQLSAYAPTPLRPLDQIASDLGLGHVFLKDESSELPVAPWLEHDGFETRSVLSSCHFSAVVGVRSVWIARVQIPRASYGAWRALLRRLDLSPSEPTSLDLNQLGQLCRDAGLTLTTCTDGNHGRALARFASLLDIRSTIFVPNNVDDATKDLIASEKGAEVVEFDGDYDGAVAKAFEYSQSSDKVVIVQDTAFEGYEDIPQWIVQVYSTLLTEIDATLSSHSLTATHLVCPVGVGSLCQAVTQHSKSRSSPSTKVISVEPAAAACLQTSLKAGRPTSVKTGETIMTGMCCGTVSTTAWPLLRDGIDASVTVSDRESHAAVEKLNALGVEAGPCGAGTLAALYSLKPHFGKIGLGRYSVVILLCTEGRRQYLTPT